jgi:hypothetical protein
MICIPQESIDKVRAIVTKKDSTTITRQKELEELFGSKEFATDINKKYESSLLLKNQDTALDKFLSNYSEMGQKSKSELRAKIKERLANRTDRIQNEELLSLAQETWNRKYKMEIPLEDMKKINDLKIESDILNKRREGAVHLSEESMAYGRKQVELMKAIEDIKYPENKLNLAGKVKNDFVNLKNRFSKEEGILGNIGEGALVAAEGFFNVSNKAFKAAWDLSFIIPNGIKVFTKSPKVYFDNVKNALMVLKDIKSAKQMQAYADEWAASMVSHPMYEQALQNKLSIVNKEDFFPSSYAESLPFIGNIFKASDLTYTMYQQGSRLGLFEKMMKTNESVMTPRLAKDLAFVANSLTSRGSLGSLESQGDLLNRMFFSARYIRSSADTFIMPFNPKLSLIARKEAMDSSIKSLSLIGSVMIAASTITEVEFDPRSSKFGKAKVPGSEDRWIDLTGRLGSYVTLAARMGLGATNGVINAFGGDSNIPEYKTIGGDLEELNTGEYASRTYWDVIGNWATGKLAPAPSTLVQIAKGRDYGGEKPSISGIAKGLYVPITAENALEMFSSDDDTMAKWIAGIADILGANQIDYAQYNN